MIDARAIAIVAKYPQEGQVKTRLSAYLDNKKTKDLYEAMLLDTLELVKDCKSFEGKYVFYRPHDRKDYFDKFSKEGFKISLQKGKDLGRVFTDIFIRLSDEYKKVIIIGSDSPTLPERYLVFSVNILDSYESVLGPAVDGGFYLIGFNRSSFKNVSVLKSVFKDINWSTDKTLSGLTHNLEAQDISYGFIPEWYDVDEPADLELLRHSIKNSREGLYRNLKRLRY